MDWRYPNSTTRRRICPGTIKRKSCLGFPICLTSRNPVALELNYSCSKWRFLNAVKTHEALDNGERVYKWSILILVDSSTNGLLSFYAGWSRAFQVFQNFCFVQYSKEVAPHFWICRVAFSHQTGFKKWPLLRCIRRQIFQSSSSGRAPPCRFLRHFSISIEKMVPVVIWSQENPSPFLCNVLGN